ncbi:hypothetical protein MKK68_27320 [Methylobacterium sp. E-016]|uniref:hypothetical protein n=1 Tax=Methylobacterium sp. E-016 TaxID=2836556 RepID=UPI001FB95CEE|nr:hypothetical protein [Methylobacterium sp. E-016]MCJ2079298.1 hypothetical protein [Methylobacterium sp. E-016]
MSDPTRLAGPPLADGPMQAPRSPAGLADAVRDQASGYADRHKIEAAGFLSELAGALRSGGSQLNGQTQVEPFVHAVADNLDAFSDRIIRRGWRELYRDAEGGRTRPPVGDGPGDRGARVRRFPRHPVRRRRCWQIAR